MRATFSLLACFAGNALAAADVVSFYWPDGTEGVNPVATIKSVKDSTTIMSLACPSGVDSSDCGWGPGLDYTIASQTRYQASIFYDGASASFACDYASQSTQISCQVAVSASEVGGMLTTTYVSSGSDVTFATATVVQGASLLSGGTAASATPTPASSGIAASVGPTSAKVSGTAAVTSAAGQPSGAAGKYGLDGAVLLMFVGAAALMPL